MDLLWASRYGEIVDGGLEGVIIKLSRTVGGLSCFLLFSLSVLLEAVHSAGQFREGRVAFAVARFRELVAVLWSTRYRPRAAAGEY